MNLQEATIKALQGKLIENLNFEVNNKWIPYDKDDKEVIENYLKQISSTNKPIQYTYIVGYDNWTAIHETKTLSLDEVRDLFMTSNDEYLVKETDDYIKVTRIESRY